MKIKLSNYDLGYWDAINGVLYSIDNSFNGFDICFTFKDAGISKKEAKNAIKYGEENNCWKPLIEELKRYIEN